MTRSPSVPPIPPTSLVLLSIVSTQLGSAIAKQLFALLSPLTVVSMRVGFAALALMLLWRPDLRQIPRKTYGPLVLFGLSLALMNLTFYLAIERIPIGIAVTLEFIGPLGVAIANSRRWLDAVWVTLAAAGILLLAPIGGITFDPLGVGLALVAGALWATYILLSVRVGLALPGGIGLALAMSLGAIALLPVGVMAGGTAALWQPHLWLIGVGVGLLSSALPYSLELEALRWLPVRVFGVLLSLEPVVAALMGFVVLQETLGLRAIAAIVLVTIAAAGSSRYATR